MVVDERRGGCNGRGEKKWEENERMRVCLLGLGLKSTQVASDTGDSTNCVTSLNIFLIVLLFKIFFKEGLKKKTLLRHRLGKTNAVKATLPGLARIARQEI